MANPIKNPMETVLDKAVKAATWLNGNEFAAGVAMARLLARQIDSLDMAQDPEAVKQLNMRIIPNFHRAIHDLGLTPQGYAKMTGANSRGTGLGPQVEEPDEPPTPSAATNPLDALAADVENVVSMAARRGAEK